MNKKLLLSFSFVIVVFVLAGCIRIPVGDGELEISKDGIEFHLDLDESNSSSPKKNDDFELVNNQVVDSDINNDDSDDSNDNDSANDQGDFNSNDSLNGDNSEMMGQGGPGLGICEEAANHTEFLVYVDHDYWIPDCAEVFSVKPYDDSVVGQFEIHEGANWEAVTYEYMAYLEQEGKLTKDEIDDEAEWKWADLEGVLSNGRKTRVEIQHQIGDYIEFHITYYYPGK